MRRARMQGRAIATLFGAVLLCLGSRMFAQQETVVYSFGNGSDGAAPYAGLVFDSSGNLYGTTYNGGAYADGTVFELSPVGEIWTETILHSFNNDGIDGSGPRGGLVLDINGNLYGTTSFGGPTPSAGGRPLSFTNGSGSAYELTPSGNGAWKETVLHHFGGFIREKNGQEYTTDAVNPYAGLVFDGSGNLYGTAPFGGDDQRTRNQAGAVFEIRPNANGGWTESILHDFLGSTTGAYPYAGVMLDSFGNLYGTTYEGGSYGCHEIGCGIVFKLTPSSGGNWSEIALRTFDNNGANGELGVYPYAGLITDSSGNLYGTTFAGGTDKCGNVACGIAFELPSAGGEVVLHTFQNDGIDGTSPYAGLISDTSGNLYGTTTSGGTFGCGTVFELSPAGGNWTETILHSFNDDGVDGYTPYAGLTIDSSGNLYGTTTAGGAYGLGTVFEITP